MSNLFTCLSCSIAFYSAEDQRTFIFFYADVYLAVEKLNLSTVRGFSGEHYRSDHHRYNMKRRVAGLPPVSVKVFNEKVLERKAETAIMASTRGSVCEVCK